jgi:RHS repeat-associated protein
MGAFSVEHRFTGQPQDDQAGGLYNYGARFYNPKWGRFISPDEVVQGFDSQGLNPYTYVLNAPTTNVDPTGTLILDGVSYGARATDIFGNVTGAGNGPISSGNGQVTVSGSRASGDAGTSSGLFLILGFAPEPHGPPPHGVLETIARVAVTDIQAIAVAVPSQLIVNPIQSIERLIEGLVDGDMNKVGRAVWQLIEGTFVPRYGFQNGSYWGRGQTSDDRLDSVLEDAGYNHDGMCDPCTSDADRVWIQTAWKDPWRLGPYGQVYRLLGTAVFRARIAWRTHTGGP